MADELYLRLYGELDRDDPTEVRARALRLAENAVVRGDHRTELECRLIAAIALTRQGDYRQSEQQLAQIARLARRMSAEGLHELEAEALNEAGNCCVVLGLGNRAKLFWARCLPLAMASQRTDMAVSALIGIGKGFQLSQDFQQAGSYLWMAVELALLLHQDGLLAQASLCLIGNLQALQRYDLAECFLHVGRGAVYRFSNRHWQAEWQLYLAICLRQRGERAQARHLLTRFLQEHANMNFLWAEIQIHQELAQLAMEEGDEAAVMHELDQACALAGQISSEQHIERASLAGYRYLKERGNPVQALHYLRQAHASIERQAAQASRVYETNTSRRAVNQALAKLETLQLAIINQHMNSSLQQNALEMRELRIAAEMDALSGVRNRRALDELFRHCQQHAAQPCGVLMIDIDHFKSINDRFGHAAGDAVIRALGGILRDACHRDNEFVARYGGEEFCLVILPADQRQLHGLARKIHRSIAEHAWQDLMPGRIVTASIGLAFAVSNDLAALQHEADICLYQAKQAGRDCIRGAGLTA